jgi:hypothetical protein
MWRFALARATGTSHARHEMPCQDRCACALIDSGIVAALADGAGSAKFAEDGAEIAVNTFVSVISEAQINPATDFGELMRGAAVKARDAVVAHGQEKGIEARHLASTLLAIVSTEYGSGAVQIGDGVIVVSQEAGEWGWVFWPQRGEYTNTTRFLTDEDAPARLEVESFSHPMSDVILISDGLEPLAIHYASKSVHHPFYNGLLGPLLKSGTEGHDTTLSTALASFLSSPAVTSRADDDVSIVMATCRPGQP